ncbi:putative solute carrier family 35 member SLC35F1/F2/F6 [Helianthus anomalus]
MIETYDKCKKRYKNILCFALFITKVRVLESRCIYSLYVIAFNKAFQFSSITSVTILNCATVIWVIILTWFFLGTKCSLWQFLGAALCVSAVAPILFLVMLVIAGTCFFVFSNVGEEYCEKKVGRIEVIAMLGLFGMLVSLIEMYPFLALFEFKTLKSISWSAEVILIFAGFGISGFMFTSLTPLLFCRFVSRGEWSHTIQSILTADMWAVVIRVFLYHQKVIFQKTRSRKCDRGSDESTWRGPQSCSLHSFVLSRSTSCCSC